MTAAAAVSGFTIPWEVAFIPAEELYAPGPWAALNLLLVAMFGLDMALSFRLAFFEGEVLVEAPTATRRHYLRSEFAADLLGFIPADWLLLLGAAALGHVGGGAGIGGEAAAAGGALEWLPVLRLLHLARLYRVR